MMLHSFIGFTLEALHFFIVKCCIMNEVSENTLITFVADRNLL